MPDGRDGRQGPGRPRHDRGRADTSLASGLAVDRFPVSKNGAYSCSRSKIEFTDVAGTGYTGGGGSAKQIADAIRDGEGVVVVHGADLNGNGTYDGVASTLDPSLSREATICGVLQYSH